MSDRWKYVMGLVISTALFCSSATALAGPGPSSPPKPGKKCSVSEVGQGAGMVDHGMGLATLAIGLTIVAARRRGRR